MKKALDITAQLGHPETTRQNTAVSAPVIMAVFLCLFLRHNQTIFFWSGGETEYKTRKGNNVRSYCIALVDTRSPITGDLQLKNTGVPIMANQSNLPLSDDLTNSYPIPQTFQFDNSPVRLTDRDGAVWFVANDVCAILEHTNPHRAITRLDEDEKNEVAIKDSMGRSQTVNIISESGLYALVMTSRKAQAKRFKKWVTAEVLPQIRKTGSYSVQPQLALEQQIEAKSYDFAKELSKQLTRTLVQAIKRGRGSLRHVRFALHTSYDHKGRPIYCNVTQEPDLD